MVAVTEKIRSLRSDIAQKELLLQELSDALAIRERQYLQDWSRLKEIDDTRRETIVRGGFLTRLFRGGGPEKEPDALAMSEARSEILNRLKQTEVLDTKKRVLAEEIGRCRLQLLAAEKAQELNVAKEARAAERTSRADERMSLLRAKAAAKDSVSRGLGSRVKKGLVRSSECPYCGNEMGADAHADHIYPLAKGGLSTPSNMVLVCATCNLGKGGMTLAAYIRKRGLNRADVEARLEGLGKEY